MGKEQDFYIGEDGLEYCSKCHTPRQGRFLFMGREITVHVLCSCEQERQQRVRKEHEEQEFRNQVLRNRAICFHDKSMNDWTFDADDGSNPSMEKGKAYISAWNKMREKGAGLLLWGSVGSGKTYMAACIANALLDKGKSVLMRDFAEISNISVFDSAEFVKTISVYDLLILDDLGAERKSEFALQNVFQVINRRWESGKPLIITTNLTIEQIRKMASSDDLQYQRIYDRILGMCTPVMVTGKSKRTITAAKNMELVKRVIADGEDTGNE
ncbi:DNA replication protein DnaC [Butyrivibrio sp. INlla18]|uniref:ATP-binding protein n=1 Tax=Butyrivibrio sp. INlla18 TaxID=1520806 RepID=UPI00088C0D61|nr:ATP-binding protein [Butyrivibrio sp. INlla18]SDA39097.1 DNA replication protein DnaC [Butyrivibrio sp. INlla18]